ncbi:hypothetical protein Tco_0223145 [Tanacetum coccineum]
MDASCQSLPGQILTAGGVDANNKIYPIAYVIVEAESKASWSKATSEGEFKKKMGELKSFNFDAYDWLIKIPLEQWSRAHFSGKSKCDLLINNICEVYPRNGRDMWPVVESRTVIIPPLYKPPIGRPPKKRKKSNDEIARKGCRFKVVVSSQASARRSPCHSAVSSRSLVQVAVQEMYMDKLLVARKTSSQPSAAQSTTKQGPMQGANGNKPDNQKTL